MAPPDSIPASGSLKARLAALNASSSSGPTRSNQVHVGSSVKDKASLFSADGAPLVPKGSFGAGLGVAEGRTPSSRELVGNRIPSAGRGGYGVTPGESSSRSSSASAARSISSSRPNPPASSTRENATSTDFSAGRQSPAPRSSMESSPNVSQEGGVRPSSPGNDSSASPVTSPSPSSPEPHTTNALPASFLSATDPDARRARGLADDDAATTISRSPSVLVNPPSVTSLSSLTSDSVSVASSYEIEAQQPPYTEVQAAEGEPTESEDDGALEMGRGLTIGGGGLGVPRPFSPVGSTIVEPGSKAPSISGDDDQASIGTDHDDEPRDAPLTPRAEHFRELSLDSSAGGGAGDTTITAETLDEDVKTPPAEGATQQVTASMMGLQMDGEEEPEVEDAEMVPALVEKEKESLGERLDELNGAPEVEIGGEAAVEAKVETWAEGVATAGGEAEGAGHDQTGGTTPSPAVEVALEEPATEPTQVADVAQAPLEGAIKDETDLLTPMEETADPVSPIDASIPIAVATAFEEDKKDRGIDPDAPAAIHPTSDFEPVPPVTPRKTSGADDSDSETELTSPIPGSFPGSPTHSSFARSSSRSSSLARAPLTLHDPDGTTSSPPSGLRVERVEDPEPSPALDMSQLRSFPSPPPTSSAVLTPTASPEQAMKRSPSMRVQKPTKSPLELDSDDEDVQEAAREGGKVTFISRERYS